MKADNRYYMKFELGKDPFPTESFDNILYLTPELKHRLERIKETIAGSSKIILVTGSPGAGKSTLADYLESIPEQGWKISLVQADAGMSREKLAYEIIQQVSPDKSDDMSYAIAQLHRFLEDASKNTIVPVFIIDDADKLPPETLKFVLELTTLRYAESLFRFVLFADETLTDRLEDPRLNNPEAGQLYKIHLPSLSRDQLKEYLDTRLSSAGEVNKYPFDDADMESIYNTSGGLPRGINILASRMMRSRIRPEPARPGHGRTVAGVAVIAAAGLIIYYTLFQGVNEIPAVVYTPVAYTSAPSQELPPATVRSEELPVPVVETEIPAPIQHSDDTTLFDSPVVTADPGPMIAGIREYQAVTAEAPVATSMIELSEIAKLPVTSDTAVVTHNTGLDTTVTEAPVVAATETLENIPIPDRPGFGQSDDNIYNLDSVADIIAGIKGNIWYRSQPQTAYTLQLISASELGNVVSLLEDLPGMQQELSGYVKYTPSGRPRYLLFYGVYPDQESASSAVATLPENLKSINPYPRSLRSITNEIDAVLERINTQ